MKCNNCGKRLKVGKLNSIVMYIRPMYTLRNLISILFTYSYKNHFCSIKCLKEYTSKISE
jgi:hypothetical protein